VPYAGTPESPATPLSQCHMLEHLNLQQHHYQNLRSLKYTNIFSYFTLFNLRCFNTTGAELLGPDFAFLEFNVEWIQSMTFSTAT
jgi:hypothetical protein